MKYFILTLHIFIVIILITLILLQSGQGGLGRAFGGGETFRSKRGAEKIVFTLTIIFSVLFLLTSIINLVVQ